MIASARPARKPEQHYVYVFGKIRKRRETRPCTMGHEGPFVRSDGLDEWMGELLAEVGMQPRRMRHYQCQTCGSDIDICRLSRVA